jgi:hypothetical protein
VKAWSLGFGLDLDARLGGGVAHRSCFVNLQDLGLSGGHRAELTYQDGGAASGALNCQRLLSTTTVSDGKIHECSCFLCQEN